MTTTINERAERVVRIALRRMANEPDKYPTPFAAVQGLDNGAFVLAVAVGIMEDEMGIGGGPEA